MTIQIVFKEPDVSFERNHNEYEKLCGQHTDPKMLPQPYVQSVMVMIMRYAVVENFDDVAVLVDDNDDDESRQSLIEEPNHCCHFGPHVTLTPTLKQSFLMMVIN